MTTIGITGPALLALIPQDRVSIAEVAIISIVCLAIGIALHALAWQVLGSLR